MGDSRGIKQYQVASILSADRQASIKKFPPRPTHRSQAGRLGEILNPTASSIYFTERSGVYFYVISIVFRGSPTRRDKYYLHPKRLLPQYNP